MGSDKLATGGTVDDFIAELRKEVGRRFELYGRGPDAWDCAGLILVKLKALGIIEPGFRLPPYSFPPNPSLFYEFLPRYCDRYEREEMRHGDIILMASKASNWQPHHLMVAIHVPHRNRWHAIGACPSPAAPRIVEMRLYESETERIVGAYRVRGLK